MLLGRVVVADSSAFIARSKPRHLGAEIEQVVADAGDSLAVRRVVEAARDLAEVAAHGLEERDSGGVEAGAVGVEGAELVGLELVGARDR